VQPGVERQVSVVDQLDDCKGDCVFAGEKCAAGFLGCARVASPADAVDLGDDLDPFSQCVGRGLCRDEGKPDEVEANVWIRMGERGYFAGPGVAAVEEVED
jgi:hypothetical protein